MKKIILLLLLSISLYSQTSLPPTTIDEYNYMTKGYHIQVASGLDSKIGYDVKSILNYDLKNYSFDYRYLIRSDKSIAGIILIATSKVWGNVYNYCIPVNNTKMMDLFNLQINAWDQQMLAAYSESSTYLFSFFFFQNNIKK